MSDTLDEKRPTRGDARRDAIVQAARKVCLEKGFSKITVSDIASEVGMTRSLFYHYFEDKEAVADAVLDNVIDEILTTLKQWNQARETGNVNKALDDIVHVLRSLIADESPFSNRMIQDGNAELYIKFIDRAADRIADYIAQTTVRDFEQMHGLPITNVHETFFTLIVGLISLIRSHPNISDRTIKEVMAQTLHIVRYTVLARSRRAFCNRSRQYTSLAVPSNRRVIAHVRLAAGFPKSIGQKRAIVFLGK